MWDSVAWRFKHGCLTERYGGREILKFGGGEVEEKEHDKRERGYMWVLIV